MNTFLGTQDANCWNFADGILSHSCLIYHFSFLTVQGFIVIFALHNVPHIFKMRQVCTARVSAIFYFECDLALSGRSKQECPYKRCHFWWQHMLLRDLYVPLSINGAFTDGHKQPAYQRCWLLFSLTLISCLCDAFNRICVEDDLQIIVFCLYLCFTQHPNFIGIGVCKSYYSCIAWSTM